MKSKIIVCVILIIIILIPIFIYNVGKIYYSHEKIYELNWEIDIPSDFKEMYHVSDKRGFRGDGIRYTIFEVKNMEQSSILSSTKGTREIEILSGDSKNVRNNELEQFVNTIVMELGIPENKRPQFHRYYIWQEFVKYNDTLVIIYFPEINLVYFAEKLI